MAARKKATAKAKQGLRNRKGKSTKVSPKASSDKLFAAIKKKKAPGIRIKTRDGDDA